MFLNLAWYSLNVSVQLLVMLRYVNLELSVLRMHAYKEKK